MAGTTITLFPRRMFDFSNIAVGQSVETVLIKALDAGQYTEGTLIVRVHVATNITGSTANIQVLVKTTSPTAEDPTNDFVNATAVATAAVNSGSLKPSIVIAQLSAGFSRQLQISVKGNQEGTLQTIKGDLSAILVLKAEG